MLKSAALMARITPLHLVPALIAAATQAGEITIEKRPFAIADSLVATALPAEGCTVLKLAPKVWEEFEILTITGHGAPVKKGEVLVSFKPAELARNLTDARREVEIGTLALAQAEFDFKTLQDTAPATLEKLRRDAAIAKEENEYFTKVRRKAGEDAVARSLKNIERMLAGQREELRRLTLISKPGTETDTTAVARQEDAVATAEFALAMETLNHKRTLEVTLPREARSLADRERETALAAKKAEVEIPRAIALAKLELAGKSDRLQLARERVADLQSDQLLLESRAPADGTFYHGAIANGCIPSAEPLATAGRIPPRQAFATFVPTTAKLALVSFLDEATARSLKPDLAGSATLAGREDVEIPVKLVKLAATPTAGQGFRADFSISWPDGFAPAPGSTARIHLISYQHLAAMVVPNRALHYEASGWTVAVKLADGKTERRPVKRGRVTAEETEIVSGLEVGQVIIVPAS